MLQTFLCFVTFWPGLAVKVCIVFNKICHSIDGKKADKKIPHQKIWIRQNIFLFFFLFSSFSLFFWMKCRHFAIIILRKHRHQKKTLQFLMKNMNLTNSYPERKEKVRILLGLPRKIGWPPNKSMKRFELFRSFGHFQCEMEQFF